MELEHEQATTASLLEQTLDHGVTEVAMPNTPQATRWLTLRANAAGDRIVTGTPGWAAARIAW